MSEEVQEHLFEPCFTTKQPGKGLTEYVLRTGDTYPDFAKLASDYFGVEKREK
jgi:hypothetical protein